MTQRLKLFSQYVEEAWKTTMVKKHFRFQETTWRMVIKNNRKRRQLKLNLREETLHALLWCASKAKFLEVEHFNSIKIVCTETIMLKYEPTVRLATCCR